MRLAPFTTLLLVFGLSLAAPARADLLMTAPESLVAGSGSTLLLRLDGLGDRDPSTVPVATVDGQNIRIDLNDECVHISCDVIEEHLFRVELPPLAAGQYSVTVFKAGGSAEADDSFVIQVAPGSAPAQVHPSDGFWMPVGMPGTGLHFQLRGDTLAVSQFDQLQALQGKAHWRLDAVPLHGDSALVLLRSYYGGSCFGCTPYEEPRDTGGSMALRLHFSTARTATGELMDGTVVALVNLPFGEDYVQADLSSAQDEFAALALPNLTGRWAIGGPVHRIVDFLPPLVSSTDATFGSEQFPQLRIYCAADYLVDGVPGCGLDDGGLLPPETFGVAKVGDVTETRIWFRTPDGQPFVGVRIPEHGKETDSAALPAEGFWSIPGQPGTGMHFQLRGDLLAVSQFDFADSDAHWRLGVAPLMVATDVSLHTHTGGSCFGCTPHVAPLRDDQLLDVAVTFVGARRATVDAGDGITVPLVNLPFGVPYVDAQLTDAGDDQFGQLALPDLSGTWAFDLHGDVPGPRIVTLEGPVFDGDTVRFTRDADEGELFGLICKSGSDVALAGCELRIGDLAIGTPPPGWYPVARLADVEENRMRFVGGPPGPSEAGFRVFYAVRMPPGT